MIMYQPTSLCTAFTHTFALQLHCATTIRRMIYNGSSRYRSLFIQHSLRFLLRRP